LPFVADGVVARAADEASVSQSECSRYRLPMLQSEGGD